MGMAASQGRLLSITARISDVEFSAQTVQFQKIRLSQQTEELTRQYTDALNKKKMTVFSGVDGNGSSKFIDATAANLTGYHAVSSTDKQRFIKDSSGKLIVSEATQNAYNKMATGWQGDAFKNTSYEQYKNMTLDQIKGDSAFIEFVRAMEENTGTLSMADLPGDANADARYERYKEYTANLGDDKMAYYQNLFCELSKSGGCTAPGDKNMNSPQWLEQQINSGNVFLYEMTLGTSPSNKAEDFSSFSWDSDTSLKEVSDKTDLAAIEAKYNADLQAIQTKDKQYDLVVKQLDTEHNALQTEMESVKKVIEKNIESSFKTFG